MFYSSVTNKNPTFPIRPFTDENDLKIEAWKAKEREKARREIFARITTRKKHNV